MKSRKGNRVCRTNEKDTRRSRNSIKKDTRRDEVADKQEKKEVEEWEKGDKMMLSTKDLVFKKWLVKKLVD